MKYKLAIFAAAVLIGLIGVLTKLIGNAVPVMSISFLRMLFATAFTLVVIPFIDKKTFKIKKKDLKGYALTGGIMAITFTLYITAMLHAPVSNVALISSLYLLFVAMLAFIFLREKLNIRHAIYIPLAFVGIYILNPFQPMYRFGSFIALLQAVFFAAFIIYLRFEQKHHGIGSVFWFFLFATIFLSPTVFIYGLGDFVSVLPYIVILGIVSTSLVYLLLSYGLHKTKANTAAIITFITAPIASILFAYLIINEAVPLTTILGGTILLAAGIIALWKFNIKKFFVMH